MRAGFNQGQKGVKKGSKLIKNGAQMAPRNHEILILRA